MQSKLESSWLTPFLELSSYMFINDKKTNENPPDTRKKTITRNDKSTNNPDPSTKIENLQNNIISNDIKQIEVKAKVRHKIFDSQIVNSDNSKLEKENQICTDKYILTEHEEDSECMVIQIDNSMEMFDKSCMEFQVLGIGSQVKTAKYIYEPEWLNYLTKEKKQFSQSKNQTLFLGHLIKYGFPKKLRHATWNFISGSSEFETEMAKNNIFYEDLIKKESKHKDIKQIDQDVKRTFNNISEVTEEMKPELRKKLRNVLIAFCHFNENCEYTQGMNSIVAMILVHFQKIEKEKSGSDKLPYSNALFKNRMETSEKNAFWLFISIMFKYGLQNLYSNNFEDLYKTINSLENKLNEFYPEFLEKVKSLDLTCFSLFIVSYMTIFMHNIELDSSTRVFDLFFQIGIESINQIWIGLLIKNKEKISTINCPMKMCQFLKQDIFDFGSKNMSKVLDPTFLENLLVEF